MVEGLGFAGDRYQINEHVASGQMIAIPLPSTHQGSKEDTCCMESRQHFHDLRMCDHTVLQVRDGRHVVSRRTDPFEGRRRGGAVT